MLERPHQNGGVLLQPEAEVSALYTDVGLPELWLIDVDKRAVEVFAWQVEGAAHRLLGDQRNENPRFREFRLGQEHIRSGSG
jgi:Uma2 family endonuclease